MSGSGDAAERSPRYRGGTLRLAATPIGNLGDMTDRVRDALRDADLVAAEDTRRARKLLSANDLHPGRIISFNRENEKSRADEIVEELRRGRDVVLVSDAGTPAVADPGEYLVRRCLDAGLVVEALPGPSAVLTALSVSGLPTGRFVFESFLPRRTGERRRRLEGLVDEQRTMVFLESPQRVGDTLAAMADVFGGQRPCAVCRELTKLHEEIARGGLADVAERFASGTRGEIVVVVGGASPVKHGVTEEDLEAYVRRLRAEGLSVRDTAARAAADLGVPRKRAYRLALEV